MTPTLRQGVPTDVSRMITAAKSAAERLQSDGPQSIIDFYLSISQDNRYPVERFANACARYTHAILYLKQGKMAAAHQGGSVC
jgi:hypothetical protein